jgi:hypothetical protein
MKKIVLPISVLSILFFASCTPDPPKPPECKKVVWWVCDKKDGITTDVTVVTYEGEVPDTNLYQNCTTDNTNISPLTSCIEPGEQPKP